MIHAEYRRNELCGKRTKCHKRPNRDGEKKQQGEIKREINEQNKDCKDDEPVADVQSLLEAAKVELLLQNVKSMTGQADSRLSTRVQECVMERT